MVQLQVLTDAKSLPIKLEGKYKHFSTSIDAIECANETIVAFDSAPDGTIEGPPI